MTTDVIVASSLTFVLDPKVAVSVVAVVVMEVAYVVALTDVDLISTTLELEAAVIPAADRLESPLIWEVIPVAILVRLLPDATV